PAHCQSLRLGRCVVLGLAVMPRWWLVEAMDANAPPVPVLKVALAARCPRCGEGALFRGLLALRERCDKCGLNYKFIDTGDGPAVFAIMILGFLVLGGALILEFKVGPPLWVHLL